MTHSTEHIALALKEARERRGLSQRELGELAGVPQGHISKIESGAVDLRASSLVALGRALGLEVVLVPIRAVSAVRMLGRSLDRRWDEPEQRPAYALDDDDAASPLVYDIDHRPNDAARRPDEDDDG